MQHGLNRGIALEIIHERKVDSDGASCVFCNRYWP